MEHIEKFNDGDVLPLVTVEGQNGSDGAMFYRVYHKRTSFRDVVIKAENLDDLKRIVQQSMDSELWSDWSNENNSDECEDCFEAFPIDDRDIESVEVNEDGNIVINGWDAVITDSSIN